MNSFDFDFQPAWDARLVLMSTKCFLIELPLEILSRICDAITDGGDDMTSLTRLGRTCRTLARIAIPRLYVHIVDRFPPGLEPWQLLATPICLNLPSLQHTLFTNHELASLVRAIQLCGRQSSRAQQRYESHQGQVMTITRPPWVNFYRNRAIQQLFGLDPSVPHNLKDPVNMLAVICLAPNLERLDIQACNYWRDTDFLLRRVNGRVAGARVTLHRLSMLAIRYRRDDDTQRWIFRPQMGINIQHLNGFFHATPHLANLEINCPRGGTSLTCRLPYLTRLVLFDAHLCARGLRLLLRDCSRLVTFIFTQEKVIRLPARFLPVSPGQILAYLGPSRRTLRNLHIAPWIPDPHHPRAQEYPLLRRLRDFPALRQIGVDFRGVEGHDTDPAALVRLLAGLGELEGVLLTGVSAAFGQAIEPFARGVAALDWPRLRTVVVQTVRMDEDRMWGRLELARTKEEQVVAGLAVELIDAGSWLSEMGRIGVRVRTEPGWKAVGMFADEV
ncbi:hypothetical protein VTI74DRAFT_10369 [Chaetomium olivicolor]